MVETQNFEIKGWCPSAYRPMRSGDGYILRLKPTMGVLSGAALKKIAEIAGQYGNGVMEITSRANLQLRGFDDESYLEALWLLKAEGHIHQDEDIEAARNIICDPSLPLYQFETFYNTLLSVIAKLPNLPAKFGYGIGHIDALADIYFEPFLPDIPASSSSPSPALPLIKTWLMRANGAQKGMLVNEETLPTKLHLLIKWFLQTGGVVKGRGRMKDHIKTHPLPSAFMEKESTPLPQPPCLGQMQLVSASHQPPIWHIGVAYGMMKHDEAIMIAEQSDIIRFTPWRSLIIHAKTSNPPHWPASIITSHKDKRRLLTICTGAPLCPQALGDTYKLADYVIKKPLKHSIHISGCAKYCASQKQHDITLTATKEGYHLKRRSIIC